MNEAYKLILKSKAKEIEALEEKIKSAIKKNPSALDEYFLKFLFNSSKRLRSLFLFLVCDFFNIKPNENIYNLACAIEILHSASLIHDDILDDAKLRRNMPCIHIEKNTKEAVLAGDYLLSLAMNILSEIKNPALFELMAKTSIKMSVGELWALDKRNTIPTLEEYLNYSKEKTASLFLFALNGLCAIEKIEPPLELIKFTENFALSFQIKDDINNFKDKDEYKKSNDIEQGIYTLPSILNAYDIMDSKEFAESIIKETESSLKRLDSGNILQPVLDILKRD